MHSTDMLKLIEGKKHLSQLFPHLHCIKLDVVQNHSASGGCTEGGVHPADLGPSLNILCMQDLSCFEGRCAASNSQGLFVCCLLCRTSMKSLRKSLKKTRPLRKRTGSISHMDSIASSIKR